MCEDRGKSFAINRDKGSGVSIVLHGWPAAVARLLIAAFTIIAVALMGMSAYRWATAVGKPKLLPSPDLLRGDKSAVNRNQAAQC